MQARLSEKFNKEVKGKLFSELRIKNFRGIKEMSISNFKLVNIFVGPNGIGKSTLLEALYMVVAGRLKNRKNLRIITYNEIRRRILVEKQKNNVENEQILKEFFHEFNTVNSIEVYGRYNNGHELKFNLEYTEDVFQFQNKLTLLANEFEEFNKKIKSELNQISKMESFDKAGKEKIEKEKQMLYSIQEEIELQKRILERIQNPRFPDSSRTPCLLATSTKNQKLSLTSFSTISENELLEESFFSNLEVNVPFIKVDYSSLEEIGIKLSQIIKSKNKQKIVEGLQLFNSKIKNFEMVFQAGQEPDIYVDLDEFSHQFPIQLLGDGILRFFKILVEVVYAKDCVILIDEIECGFYYDTLERLFEALIKLIEQNQCQLFISTHSREVIGAMHTAMENLGKKDLSVYRLSMHEKKLHATHFDFESIENHFEYKINMR